MKVDNKICTLLIGGDFFPSFSLLDSYIEVTGDVFGDSLSLIQSCDFSVINLEAPITSCLKKILKTGPNLKINPRMIKVIRNAEISLLTLANNHIYDYGQNGLEDTLNICKENKISTVGAGLTLEEAKKIRIFEIKGIKIAFVNFAENEWNSATNKHGGSNPMDIIDNAREIREARKSADYVIVIIHGGSEHYPYPTPRMKKQYRFYADQGANVIVGHHIHCVSGVEVYNKVPIFYGIGNLFFPSKNRDDGWCEGMFVKLIIALDKLTTNWELIPFNQCKNELKIKIMNEEEANNFFIKVKEISRIIEDDILLIIKWKKYVKYMRTDYLSSAIIPFGIVRRLLQKLNLFRFIRMRYQEMLLLNMIKCESHLDLLRESLEYYVNIGKK